jgi:hypothetical protein
VLENCTNTRHFNQLRMLAEPVPNGSFPPKLKKSLIPGTYRPYPREGSQLRHTLVSKPGAHYISICILTLVGFVCVAYSKALMLSAKLIFPAAKRCRARG